jgi:uncharacterized protein (DUF302 family)
MKEVATFMISACDMHLSRRGAIIAMIAAFSLPALAGGKAMAVDGLTTMRSNYGPEETMARLKSAVTARGMMVFAHIDHASAAAGVDMNLRPTDLLLFGSPKGGTPVMQMVQTIGIDLPLKALVWQDEGGTTWLSYNNTAWLAARHSMDISSNASIHAMAVALEAVSSAATSGSSGQ